MSDKMVSSYQVLLDVPQYDTGLSDMIFDTHSLYMRAADVMSEVSLNIWGSIKARYIPDNVKIDHAELCFVSWFSVEEVAATPKEKQLNRTEIVARFKKYWHEDAALNDAKLDDNTIQLFAFAPINDNFCFVDRRESFNEWNASIGFTDNDLDILFNYPKFPYPKVGDSYIFWRGFHSNQYGVGKKDDSESKIEFYTQLLSEDIWGDANTFLDKLGTERIDLMNKLWLRSPSSLQIAVSAGKVYNIKTLRTSIVKSLESYIERRRVLSDAKDRLLRYIDSKIGTELDRDHWSNVIGLAWSRLMSIRSGCLNQIAMRKELTLKLRESESVSTMIEVLNEYIAEEIIRCNVTNYRLNKKQLNGIEQFLYHFNQSSGNDFETAFTNAKNDYLAKYSRFGSKRLMEFVASPKVYNLLHGSPKTSADLFLKAFEFVDTKYVLDNRTNFGGYVGFTNNPAGVMFGDSRPTIKYNYTDADIAGERHLGSVTIPLYDKGTNQFVERTITIKSKRAISEVFYHIEGGENKLYKRHKHSIAAADGNESYNLIDPVVPKVGRKICGARLNAPTTKWTNSQQWKWYLSLAPKLTPAKINVNDRVIMGVNLGWRNPVAYATLGLTEFGEVPVKVDDELSIKLTVHDHGMIGHSLTAIGKSTDVLYDTGRHLTSNEVEQFNALCELFNSTTRFTTNSVCCVSVGTLAGHVKYTMRKYGVTDYHRQTLLMLAELMSPSFLGTTPSRSFNGDLGGLSSSRIDALEQLKQAFSTYGSLAVDEQISAISYRIDKKWWNLRKERYKVTASIIADLAIKNKVRCIAIDKPDDLVSSVNSSWMNLRISSWYRRKIVEQLKRALEPLGIEVLLEFTHFNSHLDLDETSLPRLYKITNETPKDVIVKIAKKLECYCSNSMSKHGTDMLYRESVTAMFDDVAWQNIVKQINSMLQTEDEVFVPYRTGNFSFSKFVGRIDTSGGADIRAAAIMAIRGWKTITKRDAVLA